MCAVAQTLTAVFSLPSTLAMATWHLPPPEAGKRAVACGTEGTDAQETQFDPRCILLALVHYCR